MSRTLASWRLIDFLNQSQDTVVLSADAVLDHKAVDAMYVLSYPIVPDSSRSPGSSLLSGYSRFPVHEPGNPLAYIGLLLVKKVYGVSYV